MDSQVKFAAWPTSGYLALTDFHTDDPSELRTWFFAIDVMNIIMVLFLLLLILLTVNYLCTSVLCELCVVSVFRNGYALFCQKYFSHRSASGVTPRFNEVAAAWQQLSKTKKMHYQKKASKVYGMLFCRQLPIMCCAWNLS